MNISDLCNSFVRPIVTLSAMVGLVGGFFLDKITADVFVPFATGVVVWWFKARDEQKKN